MCSDVVGLFPSLQERNTGKVVAEEVRESDKVLEGLNYQQNALYVRINKSLTGDLFSLRRILPWRRKLDGTLPGLTNVNVSSKNEKKVETQLCFLSAKPTELEKIELASRMCQIGVRAVWKNFCYSFGGKTYHSITKAPA